MGRRPTVPPRPPAYERPTAGADVQAPRDRLNSSLRLLLRRLPATSLIVISSSAIRIITPIRIIITPIVIAYSNVPRRTMASSLASSLHTPTGRVVLFSLNTLRAGCLAAPDNVVSISKVQQQVTLSLTLSVHPQGYDWHLRGGRTYPVRGHSFMIVTPSG